MKIERQLSAKLLMHGNSVWIYENKSTQDSKPCAYCEQVMGWIALNPHLYEPCYAKDITYKHAVL